eukprot:2637900-Prymnesium_polylepis.1
MSSAACGVRVATCASACEGGIACACGRRRARVSALVARRALARAAARDDDHRKIKKIELRSWRGDRVAPVLRLDPRASSTVYKSGGDLIP